MIYTFEHFYLQDNKLKQVGVTFNAGLMCLLYIKLFCCIEIFKNESNFNHLFSNNVFYTNNVNFNGIL